MFAALIALLAIYAWPSIARNDPSFVTSTTWDPVFETYGAAHIVWGTLVTSIVALVLATPVAVGAALYIAEYSPLRRREPVSFVVELLAVIPSIIYGLWGYFVLAPFMRDNVEPAVKESVGQLPVVGALFDGPTLSKDLLTGGATSP